MRRHPSLRPLSEDHHHALILARRLRRDSVGLDAAARAALESEVRREFDEHLEPHFRVEEESLLPVLEAHGEAPLAAQTSADHTRIRALVRGAWSVGSARELGALLETHVRFEERVLFPRIEALLSEPELASVREAVSARGATPASR